MSYLHHVTIETGHVRRSPASEVEAGTRQMLLPILRQALNGGQPTIPGVGPYTLSGDARGGRASTWTVCGPHGPLVTFAVCSGGKGAREWDNLAGAGDQPPHPWCAVRVEDGLARDPSTAEWIGDLERCVAWTWLEDMRRH